MDAEQKISDQFYKNIPERFEWFPKDRYGVFIHWGPYAVLGRGEQVLFREHLDQEEYEKMAKEWNPAFFDAQALAEMFQKAGFKYGCFTTRHHDGYCLWDTASTDYSSAKQAPGRDFVREYCEAMRKKGLKVGLYYSWCDWRVPAYYEGPQNNPKGWADMKAYIHTQVKELCTKYGKIDYFFFDGVWPRNAKDLGSQELVEKMRIWQPGIMINNRLGFDTDPAQLLGHGGGNEEGDFGTPEHLVNPEERLWESNQVSCWRWWGYHGGERWKSAEELLDSLCRCASTGGNLIMNVGPKPDGRLPEEFVERALRIGRWLAINGEAVYGNDGGSLTEALTYGYQTIRGNNLYLIFRFWEKERCFRLADLSSEVSEVVELSTGKKLPFEKKGDDLEIMMPEDFGSGDLFPVIRIACWERPKTNEWGSQRNWEGDPLRVAGWAENAGRREVSLPLNIGCLKEKDVPDRRCKQWESLFI